MESMRLSDKFDYSLDISPEVSKSKLLIPPLLIQPYVENAIWHGLLQKNGRGNITISFKQSKDKVTCIIDDDGIGREASQNQKRKSGMKKNSHGLKITADRLKLLEQSLGLKTTVEFVDKYDDAKKSLGTKVIVEIPIIQSKSNE